MESYIQKNVNKSASMNQVRGYIMCGSSYIVVCKKKKKVNTEIKDRVVFASCIDEGKD